MRKTHFAYPASIPALTMLGPVLPPVLDPAILYSMFRYFAHITAAILVIFSGPGVRAEHIQAPTQFIRVKSSSNGTPLSLDTSIVTYTGKNKSGESIAVDLVGAVHVADAVYYTKLNQQFQNYDRLLYELVAPKDHSVPNSLRSSQVRTAPVRTSALSALQLGLKDLLELEFQLDHVDYTRPNFVHADMSPAEFMRSMREKSENPFVLIQRLLLAGLARQSPSQSAATNLQLVAALMSGNQARGLKRLLATEFEHVDQVALMLEGEKGSSLLSARNKRAMQVLHQELQSGARHLGIFYGAAHMFDFEQRLVEELGMQRSQVRWIAAWDLS